MASVARSRRHHSFREYLALEEMSPVVKHEYVDGTIFAMAGGSPEHAALAQAIGHLLVRHVAGGPCRAFSSDLRLRVTAADAATYADASVVRGALERDPESPTHVTNPRVVVEVLSPSTEEYDRGEKRALYTQVPSLQEYVLVAQDRRRVEVWRRSDEGFVRRVHESGADVELPSIGLRFSVDELYAIAGVG